MFDVYSLEIGIDCSEDDPGVSAADFGGGGKCGLFPGAVGGNAFLSALVLCALLYSLIGANCLSLECTL
jgi:hypothetical protein